MHIEEVINGDLLFRIKKLTGSYSVSFVLNIVFYSAADTSALIIAI